MVGDNEMLGNSWHRFVRWLFAVFVAIFAYSDVAQACEVSSDKEIFALLSKEVPPYLPSLDEQGNPYLTGTALVFAEINHYRNAISDADYVKLSYQRYASLTADEDSALKDFESRIIVIGPECSELQLFQGELIGNVEMSLSSYLEMFATADNLGHEKLRKFVNERVRIRAISFNEIVGMLLNDLRYDTALMMKILPDELKQSLALPAMPSHKLGAELALIVYALKGGAVDSDGNRAFILKPATYKGMLNSQNTVVLLSNGRIVQVPDLIIGLSSYGLGQLNVVTTVLSLEEVMKDKKPRCEIDESNFWFSTIGGKKIRKCAFNEHLVESLLTGDWIYSRDRLTYPMSFQEIEELL